MFDDARLTDAAGQEADFRHCIIILTTNLGATSHRSADLGFLPGTSTFSSDQVLRAVSQTFRPEFQNRLDKVIVFQPLDRELMRGILKKELSRVLERRGFKDREWAVEWEASALEFLLEKGFSPEMGARPLKRAIDQYVIAPLAATIVERRFPEGDQFVFVRSDGKAIQAEFVDPDGDAGPPPRSRPGGRGQPAFACGHDPRTRRARRAELQALERDYEEILDGLRLGGLGGGEGEARREDSRRGVLDEAGALRSFVAARAHGPRARGGGHGGVAARAARQGRGARGPHRRASWLDGSRSSFTSSARA